METTPAFSGLECTGCGEAHGVDVAGRCPDCGAPLGPIYNFQSVEPEKFRDEIDRRLGTDGLWAFEDILPFPADQGISGGEGGTPLVDAPEIASELGVDRVQLKDESRNPTGTILDRGVSLATTAVTLHAQDRDVEPLALASPGNSAQSVAAYAGKIGVRSYAFVPSRCAFANKAMVNVHGGEMRVIGGRYDDAISAVDEELADFYSLQEFTTPYRHEGIKTIAFELLADRNWTPPDAVVVPTGTGEVLVGLIRGLEQAVELGLIHAMPTIIAVQPEGCAPIAVAHERGLEEPEPWETPDTIVGELEIPDPAGGKLAVAALDRIDGHVVTVSDDDILESAVSISQTAVIEMGAAGGAAAAGGWKFATELAEDDDVVLVNTESGGKTPDVLRSHLMGKGI